jgi:hypothetical protein
MIVNGLAHDFYAETFYGAVPDYSFDEFPFSIETPKYKVKGFLDKLFIHDGTALIRDFKTSKEIFSGDDVSSNLQDLIYRLAVDRAGPAPVDKTFVEFVFVKPEFVNDPNENHVVRTEDVSKFELAGIEYMLEEAQNIIDSFSEKTAKKNFAAF